MRSMLNKSMALVAATGLLLSASEVKALETSWQPVSGYWNDSGNWNNGVPTAAVTSHVSGVSLRTAIITNNVPAQSAWLDIAYASGQQGAVQMTGGTFQAGRLHIAHTSSVGTFDLSGGAVNVTDGRIGMFGAGTFAQSGGSVTGNYWVIGYDANSYGVYTQSTGTAYFTSVFDLGLKAGAKGVCQLSGTGGLTAVGGVMVRAGQGLIVQDGGILDAGTSTLGLNLGYSIGGRGTYVLNGGALKASYVNVGASGWGCVTQYAGAATVAQSLYVAQNAGSTGSYTLVSGKLSASNHYVGFYGYGTFEQYGGTNTVLGTYLMVSAYNGSYGRYALHDGWVSCTNLLIAGNGAGTSSTTGMVIVGGGRLDTITEVRIGSYGSGTLIQTGGVFTCAGELDVGLRTNSVGVYTQTAGEARFNKVYVGKDAGTYSNRYVIAGGTATMTSLDITTGASQGGTFGIVGTNAGVTVVNALTVGAGGTYEVTLGPDGFSAPYAGQFTLSATARLKVLSRGFLQDNVEIPIVTFGSWSNVRTFGTVEVETGTKPGELRSATPNYYDDRITLTIQLVPPPGTLIRLL